MKSLASRLYLAAAIALIGVSFLGVFSPQRASAAVGLENICVPSYTEQANDRWTPGTWISFDVIDRFHIRVTYTPAGNCVEPATTPPLSSEFLFINRQTRIADVLNGLYTIQRFDEGGVGYVLRAGSAANDDSRIDILNWGSVGLSDDTANFGMYRTLTDAQITSFFSTGEYTPSIEEDAASGPTCEENNSNIFLANINSDGLGPVWNCIGEDTRGNVGANQTPLDSSLGTGMSIATRVTNANNFNITLVSNSDGSRIVPLSGQTGANFTFSDCNGSYRTNNCNGTDVINGLTREQVAAIPAATPLPVTITTADGTAIPTLLASATSQSGTIPGGGGVGVGGGGVGGVPDDSCEGSIGKFGWLVCFILEFIDGAVNWLDTSLQTLLLIDDPTNTSEGGTITAGSTDDIIRNAWGAFRNVALIILIPIMLTMVMGTAINIGFLDAYTIRRSMPRLVVAIVFISISWYFTGFLINMSNVIGTGIQGLMVSTICEESACANLTSLVGVGTGATLSAAGVGIFVGLAKLQLFWGLLINVGGVVLAALFIGFFLLVLRQVVILALVLLAPLAILSWVFPGNNKLWKLWWTTFSGLLILFPVIMIVIGASKIFAYVVASS